jgi:TPR repeat protein
MRHLVNGRHILAAALLLPLALAGCGGLRNEATALGIAPPATAVVRADLAPADAYARGREAEAAGQFETAEQLYIVAANGGSTDARVTLGSMYLAGRGVNRDHAEALH